jgi:hypothetical protein
MLFMSLVLAACGGGGSANEKGPAEGHYVGELISTDFDQTLADIRKFTVEFDVIGENKLSGGKITYKPTGDTVSEPEIITGEVRTGIHDWHFLMIWFSKVPGKSVHLMTAIHMNTGADGEDFDQTDPTGLIKCKMAGQEFGDPTDRNFEPAGFRFSTYIMSFRRTSP